MSICPTVSVILPTFNRAQWLPRAISSLAAQTFDDWECIIVDDGSTDATGAILNQITDPRIKSTRHESNQGVSTARNTGTKLATGKYLAFLDSDDEWLPRKLERQVETFETSSAAVGVVICGAERVDDVSLRTHYMSPRLSGAVFEQLLARDLEGAKGTCALMVHRRDELIEELYFDTSLPASEDYDLLLRLSRKCEFAGISEPLIRIHDHKGSRAYSGANIPYGHEIIFNKYAQHLNARPDVKTKQLKMLGVEFAEAGIRNKAVYYLIKVTITPPRSTTAWLYLVPALLGASATHVVVKATKALRTVFAKLRSRFHRRSQG